MDKDDFWSGVRLVVDGLGDAAKRASYSLGLGAGGLGGAILALNYLGVTGVASTLIAMSAFFLAAQIGKALDGNAERYLREAELVNDLRLKQLERKIAETEKVSVYIQNGKDLDGNAVCALREAELVNDFRLKQLEQKIAETEKVDVDTYENLLCLRQMVERIAQEDSISRRRMLLEEYESLLNDILRRHRVWKD